MCKNADCKLWLRRKEFQLLYKNLVNGKIDIHDFDLNFYRLYTSILRDSSVVDDQIIKNNEILSQAREVGSILSEYFFQSEIISLSDYEDKESDELLESGALGTYEALLDHEHKISLLNYNESSVLQSTMLFFSLITSVAYLFLKPDLFRLIQQFH